MACVLSLLAGGPAFANGRFPAANQLLVHPREPTHMLLRATYGLLLTRDGGATWDWICERAVGYGGVEDPSLAILGDGRLVAGLFAGVSESTDDGCSWKRSEEVPEVVGDLAVRAGTPDTVYAIADKYAGRGDAGSYYRSELYVSVDGGARWSRRAALDPTLLLESVEVAPSDPRRMYVTAIRESGKSPGGVLLVSDDEGAHWIERPVLLEAKERAPFVAGVDPRVKDRVYLRTSGPETNRLLVTDDAGKTMRTLFTGGALLGFALADDGSKIFLGGPTDGLQVASAPSYRFEPRWAMPVQCLALIGRMLWACSSPKAGFELGSSADDGMTFTPRLVLGHVRGPLACADASSMGRCPQEWASLRADFGFGQGADAGSPRPTSPAATGMRCGCAVPGETGRGRLTGQVVVLLLALALARRRKRPGSTSIHVAGCP